jgi:hypothetical protein
VAETALGTSAGFRTIGERAVRCGHYCWLESRLFALTGHWASAPLPDGVGAALDPEIRVRCSRISSWHGFLAGQWHDRLPVRAGVDAGALIVPPPGPAAEALDLPSLLAAYDDDFAHASPVSELPVLAVLELARARAPREIEEGRDLLGWGAAAGTEVGNAAQKVANLRGGLQQVLGANGSIFPAAWAS